MEPDKTHVAEAFAALTGELYNAARTQGTLDPFILLAGPELLCKPWLERYFSGSMLREIYAAMQEREELYCVERDLLDLLHLQFNPITLEEQRDISKWFEQQYGLLIHPKDIVWMTDGGYEAAVTRLTSFVSDVVAQSPEREVVLQYWQRHVPLVFRTAYKEQSIRDQAGQLVHIKPIKLTPQPVVRWFQKRLLFAVETRLKRYPDNPLWILPDGSIQGTQVATHQDLRDFAALIERICHPVRRGAPSGPRDFQDNQEFLETLSAMIRLVASKGLNPTQPRVAQLLRSDIEHRRRDSISAAQADSVDSTARLIRKRLPPGGWQEFVKNALDTS